MLDYMMNSITCLINFKKRLIGHISKAVELSDKLRVELQRLLRRLSKKCRGSGFLRQENESLDVELLLNELFNVVDTLIKRYRWMNMFRRESKIQSQSNFWVFGEKT